MAVEVENRDITRRATADFSTCPTPEIPTNQRVLAVLNRQNFKTEDLKLEEIPSLDILILEYKEKRRLHPLNTGVMPVHFPEQNVFNQYIYCSDGNNVGAVLRIEPDKPINEISRLVGVNLQNCSSPKILWEIPRAQDGTIDRLNSKHYVLNHVGINCKSDDPEKIESCYPQVSLISDNKPLKSGTIRGSRDEKDIRFTDIGNNRMVIINRVRQENCLNGQAIRSCLQIGFFDTPNNMLELARNMSEVKSAPPVTLVRLTDREWIGPNQILSLVPNNGEIREALLFHIGRYTDNLVVNEVGALEYEKEYFALISELVLDPIHGKLVSFTRPKIIATPDDFSHKLEPKRRIHKKVIFPVNLFFTTNKYGEPTLTALSCGVREKHPGITWEEKNHFTRPLNPNLNKSVILPPEVMERFLSTLN